MLNWLKRKAKIPLQSRYSSIIRSNNLPEMILTEQSMVPSQQSQTDVLKLIIYNSDGEEYSLDVLPQTTIGRVKMMAVGHFYTPLEAVGGSSFGEVETGQNWCERTSSGMNYRLVLTRGSRTLLDEHSLHAESLANYDELLLIECRKNQQNIVSSDCGIPVTAEKINQETSNIPPKNLERCESTLPSVDFKIALRRILLTMIEASVHLIASEDDFTDTFVHIFELLEKRHQPRVDSNSLKQLTEMGFPEARATKALFLKRNLPAAMDWLLDEANVDTSQLSLQSNLFSLSFEQKKDFFMADGIDPAVAVLQEFNNHINKWFQPESKAVEALKNNGYGEDVAKEALRASHNNEAAARSLLEGDSTMADEIQKGFSRDSPIMVAILESPIVQVALSKHKTLYALMVLCENPSNVNVWLNDTETHPVISQVLRIYHAEKHRLSSEKNSSCRVPQTPVEEDGSERVSDNAFRYPLSDSFPLRLTVRSNNSTTGDNNSVSGSNPSQVAHLTLTYTTPTTEGGVPTVSLRLERSSSRTGEVEDVSSSFHMDTQ